MISGIGSMMVLLAVMFAFSSQARVPEGDLLEGVAPGPDGMIDVLNCTLTANTATSSGGGVTNDEGGSLDLVNSTLSGNTAPSAGGVALSSGVARAWDAILAADVGGECGGTWADGSPGGWPRTPASNRPASNRSVRSSLTASSQ